MNYFTGFKTFTLYIISCVIVETSCYNKVYEYYCKLDCVEQGHTYTNVACENAPCLPNAMCGPHHQRYNMSDSDRRYITDLHNSFRDKIASGKEKRGGNGEAGNMRIMSYDKELEFLAACWANQCYDSYNPAHGRDKCRATPLYEHNGQNHFALAYRNETDWSDLKFFNYALNLWSAGVSETDEAVIDSYRYDDKQAYEFYTQLVWANSYLVGCGRTRFSTRKWTGINIICNYGPTGNVIGEPVYRRGAPCSYLKEKINENYTSLCGQVRDLEDDHFVPPYTLAANRNRFNLELVLLFSFYFFS